MFFPVRLTDDLGAIVLLERRGDDLGRGCRSVDEDGDRQVPVRRDAVTGRRVFLHVPVRGLLGEDQAVVDELAGDLLRGVDIPAGVVAEIEDDLVGALVEQLLEPGPELVGGRGGEAERDEADVVIDHPRLDFLELDLGAGDRHIERLAVVALDRERDVSAGLAADLADLVVDRRAVDRLPVDGEDVVPRQDSAASAGDSSSGATTTRRQVSLNSVHDARSEGSSVFVMAISAPMPLKLPDRSPSACWYWPSGGI